MVRGADVCLLHVAVEIDKRLATVRVVLAVAIKVLDERIAELIVETLTARGIIPAVEVAVDIHIPEVVGRGPIE